MLKVLDFSADNDQEPDSNGEFTGATLKAGFLHESFTICSAMMVEAWTTEFQTAEMFRLLDVNGETWGELELFAANSYTEIEIHLGELVMMRNIPTAFFPSNGHEPASPWTRLQAG